MMKAAILSEFNTSPRVEERNVPEPDDDGVVIRQTYTGICFRDILTLKGRFPKTTLPIIPGHEVAGVIASKGKDVHDFEVGDRVSGLIYMSCGKCRFCLGGRENLCRSKRTLGENADGSYAPYVLTDRNSIVRVPDGVDEESAVIAACVTGMIVQALRNRARVVEGETVLVTGAGGGVGAHAVQIAKALGARVIASSSSGWKRDGLLDLGAEAVISPDDMSRKVKALTGGEGADIVIENVGGPTFRESLKSLNFGGRLVDVGNVEASSVDLPLGYLILKGLEVIGSVSSTRENMKEALQLSKSGKVKAVIDRKIGLDAVAETYRDMQNRSTFGRVLIRL